MTPADYFKLAIVVFWGCAFLLLISGTPAKD